MLLKNLQYFDQNETTLTYVDVVSMYILQKLNYCNLAILGKRMKLSRINKMKRKKIVIILVVLKVS